MFSPLPHVRATLRSDRKRDPCLIGRESRAIWKSQPQQTDIAMQAALKGIDLFTQKRHRALNTFHTWLLAAGSLALLAISAWAYGGTTGIIYAVVFGVVSLIAVRRVTPQMVLRMYKAQPVTRDRFPAGFDMIEELARRAELPTVPKLYVIPSRMLNAFAVGRRDDSAIAITDALARSLTGRELAGVLAHEVSHVAHEDVKVMAMADTVSRFTSLMSTMGMLTLFFNLGGVLNISWLAILVLLAAPTVGGLLQMALSRTREFDADLGAAMLTGDPDGLASALVKLEKAQGRRWENMILPGGRIPDPSLLRTHPKTEDRVARLNALKRAGEAVASGAPVPEDVVRTVPARPSGVPRIRRNWGRGDADTATWASLISAQNSQHPPVSKELADCPTCGGDIARPEGRPRIHVTRGGVWW